MDEIFAVVMAGGRGERFWPASREARPKQLLKIFGASTLLESAVERLKGLVAPDHILVITNQAYTAPIRALFPHLPPENIIGEPQGRDTAPCVALAAGIVASRANGGAVMMTIPADPLIRDRDGFADDAAECCRLAAAEPGRIVTIGVKPTFASTAYGYIERGGELTAGSGNYRVLRFREKPDAATAAEFLKSGGFFWNCGMFFWRCDTILDALRRHAPDLAGFAEAVSAAWRRPDREKFLADSFPKCRKISIDYAVLESSRDIVVRQARFDWDDVGNWSSLRGNFPADADGNVARGPHRLLDCRNAIVFNSEAGHTVCSIGVDDLVIVHTSDATLVCPAGRTADIKELLRLLAADPDLKKLI